MTNWNPDKYIKAWNFASEAHTGQLVPGTNHPYTHHLSLVAMESMATIANTETINNPELLVQCAVLHDTIEDTDCNYDNLLEEFGAEVADGVLALTKNDNISDKSLRMKESLARIKEQPQEIWMVKLCDRITNLLPPPGHWTKDKIEVYRDEAKLILESLGDSNQYLSERLQFKIYNYNDHLGPFTVYVDDNWNFGDESSRYKLAEFETYEEAVEACKAFLNESLEEELKEDRPVEESGNMGIYGKYCLGGDDPWIQPVPEGRERFSGREYVLQWCKDHSIS